MIRSQLQKNNQNSFIQNLDTSKFMIMSEFKKTENDSKQQNDNKNCKMRSEKERENDEMQKMISEISMMMISEFKETETDNDAKQQEKNDQNYAIRSQFLQTEQENKVIQKEKSQNQKMKSEFKETETGNQVIDKECQKLCWISENSEIHKNNSLEDSLKCYPNKKIEILTVIGSSKQQNSTYLNMSIKNILGDYCEIFKTGSSLESSPVGIDFYLVEVKDTQYVFFSCEGYEDQNNNKQQLRIKNLISLIGKISDQTFYFNIDGKLKSFEKYKNNFYSHHFCDILNSCFQIIESQDISQQEFTNIILMQFQLKTSFEQKIQKFKIQYYVVSDDGIRNLQSIRLIQQKECISKFMLKMFLQIILNKFKQQTEIYFEQLCNDWNKEFHIGLRKTFQNKTDEELQQIIQEYGKMTSLIPQKMREYKEIQSDSSSSTHVNRIRKPIFSILGVSERDLLNFHASIRIIDGGINFGQVLFKAIKFVLFPIKIYQILTENKNKKQLINYFRKNLSQLILKNEIINIKQLHYILNLKLRNFNRELSAIKNKNKDLYILLTYFNLMNKPYCQRLKCKPLHLNHCDDLYQQVLLQFKGSHSIQQTKLDFEQIFRLKYKEMKMQDIKFTDGIMNIIDQDFLTLIKQGLDNSQDTVLSSNQKPKFTLFS